MNSQVRGFLFSSVIHIVALSLLIFLNGPLARPDKPLVIDFSMDDTSAGGASKTASEPRNREVKVRQPEQPRQGPVAATQGPVPLKTVAQQAAATSEKTATETQAPATAGGSPFAHLQSTGNSSSVTTNPSRPQGNASSSPGKGVSGEAMKQSYLKEHFAYIRRLVQQKLSYPKMARKRGWEGKVIVSFVVCIDGHARDITIRESSGIEVLDKNATVAVRDASPFPRPPIEAQMIIPISYTLN